MPRQQDSRQKKIVGRVMREFKEGDLERGDGGKVKNPKQAIAIALSEAGASNRQSPRENRRRLERTQARETHPDKQDATRSELYAQARQAGIRGRSGMGREELREALPRR